jgi:putative transcriptional regulator
VCRGAVSQAEAVGGVLLEDEKSVPLDDHALQSVLSRLDDAPAARPTASRGSFVTPEPLRSYIGGDLDGVKWTRLGGGICFKPVFRRGKSRAYLVRSKPGRDAGWHTHRGEEFTLCLTGGYTDETGQYARGDLQSTTPDVLHRPVTDDGEECIVLAVSDARLKFRNPLIGLIGLLSGF